MINDIKEIKRTIIESSAEDINIDFLNNRVSFILKKWVDDNKKILVYQLNLEDLDKIEYYGLKDKKKIISYARLKSVSIEKGDYLALLTQAIHPQEIAKIRYEEENKNYYEIKIELTKNLFEFRCKNITLNLIKESI